MTGHDQDEKFLRRWSRRKIDDSTEEPVPPEADTPDDAAAVAPEQSETETAEIVADLPDIDTLHKDSDFTGFLRDGVPEELKRLALRKLWRSDPVLANLDGLNDYDEDFGAILKSGAEYMQRLADAGEKFTRPGAEEKSETEPAGEVTEEPVDLLADEVETDIDADDTDLANADPRSAKDPSTG